MAIVLLEKPRFGRLARHACSARAANEQRTNSGRTAGEQRARSKGKNQQACALDKAGHTANKTALDASDKGREKGAIHTAVRDCWALPCDRSACSVLLRLVPPAQKGTIMHRLPVVFGVSVAAAFLASPILAERSQPKKLSPQCMREVVQMCGTDRLQYPSCVADNSQMLSKKCRKQAAERLEQRREERAALIPYQRTATPTRTIVYGSHQRQQVDIYESTSASVIDARPLVVYIHGGAWRTGDRRRVLAKPVHLGDAQLHFASAGYRVLPEAPVEDQARDIGQALQALIAQADMIGFDPEKLVLMGHSAGAHLAALVATDPQYAGEAFAAIQGVIVLDGAAYDVAQTIKTAQFETKSVYEYAFGYEAKRHAALSAISHIGGPDAPHWLALYVAERDASREQSETLIAALQKAGLRGQAIGIEDTDHSRINTQIGTTAGSTQTQAIDDFLAELFQD